MQEVPSRVQKTMQSMHAKRSATTRAIQDLLHALSEVYANEDDSSSKTQFDEFVHEHEFELALHLLCDYLISKAASITVSRMLAIDELHAKMQIRDNCISELEDARAQYEQFSGPWHINGGD